MNKEKKLVGLQWNKGAIGNAEWRGISFEKIAG